MKRLTLIIAFVCAWFFSSAQMNISGNVTDSESGEGIPGVTVSLNGFSDAVTITDFDGKYSLEVPEGGKSLTFMYIGMTTKTVEINNQTVINIQLEKDAILIDDVVVTALGISREERSLGYSIDNISADDIAVKDPTSVSNSLQGRVAGIQIKSGSGTVGGSSNVLIRGASSLGGSNQPLHIVDGTPIANYNYSNTILWVPVSY